MIPTLPLIHQFSALTQSGILASLLLISYLNTRARYLVLTLLSLYLGAKIVPPICKWGLVLFKWIAMLGFYGTYFQIGLGFVVTGFGGVLVFFENAAKELEKGRTGR
ncbi:hypothetical protein BDZ94DRAFT_1275107 [Collybia nuda]|uniref:Uncharacterized protein n=1 Tax=Collybia nuda TaxID=64659 RepID=A0A9P6C925_9AGAR|nr:hypothetical protein BDZ94DRAFT_1275107 [Collybia nuda]